MNYFCLPINTQGEAFYPITKQVEEELSKKKIFYGAAILYCPHTSCALALNEDYDPSAREDMQNFMQHLAPRNLPFISHTAEGKDDSPSHMKSILLQPSLHFIVENSKLVLGRWQGIFLAEFRDAPKERTLYLKAWEC